LYHVAELLGNPHDVRDLERSLHGDLEALRVRSAKLKVTYRCNLRCTMCSYPRMRPDSELSTEQWFSVLRGLHGEGCRKVHFSGGEALLRDDIVRLLSFASQLGMKVNMTTNGTLIDKKRARDLVRAKLNSISFSLDGPFRSLHERIRGVKGSFRKILNGVRYIRQAIEKYGASTKIRINVVLMRCNYESLPDLIDLAADLGATEVHPMPVDEKGKGRNRLRKKDIVDFNARIVPEVERRRRKHGFSLRDSLVYPFGRTKEEINYAKEGEYARGFFDEALCYVPWLHTFVTWNGSVYLCCMMRGRIEPLGNAGNEAIGEIFRGKAYREVRRTMKIERPAPCRRCDDFLDENRDLNRGLFRSGSPCVGH
jgi:MoaA/NifB/PqqE/SkfB family radical SAM enzyme